MNELDTLDLSYYPRPGFPENLAGTQLRSLFGLPKEMENLRSLRLDHNKLKDFEGMPKMPKLEVLSATSNGVSSLLGLPAMP